MHGLSLRTIRSYEDVDLVRPSARTLGGFRLYTEPDVARLNLVKCVKTLEFSVEEMRDLLAALDELENHEAGVDRSAQLDRLARYRAVTEERCRALRQPLDTAEEFATGLRREISRQRRLVGRPR